MAVNPKLVKLKGNVEATLLHHAADRLVTLTADGITVELDTSGPTEVSDILSPTDALAAATLIAVVMRAILKTRVWLHKRRWTEARLREVITQALALEGVTQYDIVAIRNLNCLRGEDPCPCIVSAVSTSTRKGYDIHIFLDGTIFTFNITPRIAS